MFAGGVQDENIWIFASICKLVVLVPRKSKRFKKLAMSSTPTMDYLPTKDPLALNVANLGLPKQDNSNNWLGV